MSFKYHVAIVGARGYTGVELSKLLLGHPNIEQIDLYSSDTTWDLSHELLLPASAKWSHYSMESFDREMDKYAAIFLATTTTVSLDLVPKILRQTPTCKIVDLSGAFRLPSETFSKWYNETHNESALCGESVYGLTPYFDQYKNTRLISNPGCYVTAILMGLIPLLRSNLIDPSTIVIDAKSGTTGAGKTPRVNTLFSEIDGNYLPYKLGTHQHYPEICHYAAIYGKSVIRPIFTTSLLPIRRGINATIYAKLRNGLSGTKEITSVYEEYYSNYPLVKLYPLDQLESSVQKEQALSLKNVVNTPYTKLTYMEQDGTLVLFSMIDNLMKGASSQAIENFNCLMNLPLPTGLIKTADC